MISDTRSLVETIDFDLLSTELGSDVESAISGALAGGAVFSGEANPLSIFRNAVASSIRNIESHERGKLLQSFLLKGPYENEGPMPEELKDQRLTDNEIAHAITFIYSFMVNNFKGAVTELLASGACVHLVEDLRRSGAIPREARVYVEDAVKVHRKTGKGMLKGADLYILIEERETNSPPAVNVVGVVEVKSGSQSEASVEQQLDSHIMRCTRGLHITGVDYPTDSVRVGLGPEKGVLRIGVRPSDWKLPRIFRFEATEKSRLLHVEPPMPPEKVDLITMHRENTWRITLKWSKEAIAAAAYEMTFWYMEKVGERIYSQGVPREWKDDMNQAEAGRNAAKMMLNYAIRRFHDGPEAARQRAIALYNTYGFGYALGMNFVNAEGKREMLWPEDLDEILSEGKTKSGCRIV